MFKITKEQALEIQAEQLAYYEPSYPGITAKIKALTTADQLEPDTLYDIVVINRHIPRGGAIERQLGLPDMGGEMSWIIVNVNDPELCWNNQDGWQSDNYDTFTDEEREELNLPFDGEWKQVPWNKED